LFSILQHSVLNQCVTCEDNSVCCDGENCCSGGKFCCPNSSLCCDDECCDSATETCCPDPQHGAICCIEETTFCCPPDDMFPSRCCPRWMICCQGGRYGCCDPDEVKKEKATTKAWALFEIPTWSDDTPLYSLNLDFTTGYKTQTEVNGFNDWGEMTRLFTFDERRSLFYLPQANFTNNKHDITIFIIDPTTGKTTSKPINGPVDLVTGFTYHYGVDKIIFATYLYQSNKKVGYNFYSTDPVTFDTKLISTYMNQNGDDSYVGWFHELSSDGTKVYRVGFRDVVRQIDFGLSTTDISKSVATMSWFTNISIPDNFGFYVSLNLYKDRFLSLAPSTAVWTEDELSLIEWGFDGTSKIILDLGDAHETPFFGPIAEAMSVDETTYVAVYVSNSMIDQHLDRWAVASVDLTTGKYTINNISPWMMAETDSISGLGIPAN